MQSCTHARAIDLTDGSSVCTACEAVIPPVAPPSISAHGICPLCWSTDVSRTLGVCWSCERRMDPDQDPT